VHKDANNITTTSNHDVELVEFKYPVISQVYLDLVAIYMENLSIQDPFPFIVFFLLFRFIKYFVVKTRLEITLKHE
jgi:hypothetical protein